MFKDKVYDEMDEISRLFEPFQYDLNDELAKFPDKIEILPEDILKYGVHGTDLYEVLGIRAGQLELHNIRHDIGLLVNNDFFKFVVETDDKTTVNLDANSMNLSKKIYLIKNKIAFDELMLETMRKEDLLSCIRNQFYDNRSGMNKPRFNEIADIYGAKEVKSQRSCRGKVDKFCSHMATLLDDKTLDIRDMALCKKFNRWIILYVMNGNLAALNNLTRIKIITHEKRPIYSIEEKVV